MFFGVNFVVSFKAQICVLKSGIIYAKKLVLLLQKMINRIGSTGGINSRELGEKPGLEVRAEGSHPKGREFESRHILDGCKRC